jgi:hypothetical protein
MQKGKTTKHPVDFCYTKCCARLIGVRFTARLHLRCRAGEWTLFSVELY